MALPVERHSVRLKEQLVVMGSAMLVAGPPPLTPCVASVHQLYPTSPRCGSAGCPCTVRDTLSASVRRDSRSAARASRLSAWLQMGQPACDAFAQKPLSAAAAAAASAAAARRSGAPVNGDMIARYMIVGT